MCGPCTIGMMQLLRSHPDLLNQSLHFDKIPREFARALQFDRHRPGAPRDTSSSGDPPSTYCTLVANCWPECLMKLRNSRGDAAVLIDVDG